jgi:hypothetical protein
MSKLLFVLALIALLAISCVNNGDELKYDNPNARIIFLHRSTGFNVWQGSKLGKKFIIYKQNYDVPRLMKEYNMKSGVKYAIRQFYYPSDSLYPVGNFPYDYYKLWVENAVDESYSGQFTLETFVNGYDLIIFKFCYPVSNILADDTIPDIISDKKTISNYKLQMNAIKTRLKQFPETKFLVWTGAVQVKSQITEDQALRTKEFFQWLEEDWDEENDNIFIFDFLAIETEGDLYLKPEFATNNIDSHPNRLLSSIAARELVKRIHEILGN